MAVLPAEASRVRHPAGVLPVAGVAAVEDRPEPNLEESA